MKPLRFHPHIQSGPYHRLNPCMVESKDGAYVLYADYAKLEELVLALQDHCPHTYGRMYPNNECALCGKVV